MMDIYGVRNLRKWKACLNYLVTDHWETFIGFKEVKITHSSEKAYI